MAPRSHRSSQRTALVALAIALAIPWLWPLAAFDGVVAHGLLAATYVLAFFVFGGLGHIFVHQESRLSILGDLFMLSSYEWKTTHCIEHHGFTNDPKLDGDVGVFSPIIHFAPGHTARLQRLAPVLLLPIYALSFTIIRFQLLVELWRDPRQRARRSVLYVLGSYGWLVLWAANGHFWVGLGLECTISLVFCALTMVNHNHAECHEVAEIRDFVAYQLESTRDWGPTGFWPSMLLGFFLGTQSLHHLFPTLDPRYLGIVQQELEAMGYQRPVRPMTQLLREHLRFIWRSSTRATSP